MDAPYAVAGEKRIEAHIEAAEGVSGLSCHWQILRDGASVAEQTAAEPALSYLPELPGEYRLIATIEDALGRTASAEASLIVIDAAQTLRVQLAPSPESAVAGLKPVCAGAEALGGWGSVSMVCQLWLDGALICEAAPEQQNFSCLTDVPGDYTLTLIATDEIGQRAECSAAVSVLPRPEPITLTLTHSAYGAVNETNIDFQTEITGGLPEYAVLYQIYDAEGLLLAEQESAELSWSYAPQTPGTHTAVVTVTDGAGQTATAQAEIPVAAKDWSNPADWLERAQAVELTGDWRRDMIAIAETQLGYRESDIDFIIDEQGQRLGYSIYGDLYGMDYAGWCAMFISACIRFAGIPEEDYPISSSCEQTQELMISMDAYEPIERRESETDAADEEYDSYLPKPGDLIFFGREGYREDEAHHIGLVTETDGLIVKTIEGNAQRSVERREYALTDEWIIGYANTAKLMVRAEVFPQEEITAEIVIGSLNAQPLMLLSEESSDDGLTIEFTVAAGGLSFRYSSVRQQIWNPDAHVYEPAAEMIGKWIVAEEGGNQLAVKNTSIVAIEATVSAEIGEDYPNLTVTINDMTEGVAQIEPDETAYFTIGISGRLDTLPEDSDSISIGTIRIELAAAN